MASEASTMFDPNRANEIIKDLWERDKALPVKSVMAALRDKRMGRSTKIVSDAIKRFMEGLGQPGQEPEAFPVDPAAPEAVSPETKKFRRSSKRSKTAKQAVAAADPETENHRLNGELVRMAQEAKVTADRLAQVEERFRALEAANEHLGEHVEERLRALDEGNQRFLTQLEERLWVVQADNERLTVQTEEQLRILEAGDGRLWERVMASRRQRSAGFWERVYNAVPDIRDQYPNLTRHDIMALIPEELVQEGKDAGERMDDVAFRYWMDKCGAGSSAGG